VGLGQEFDFIYSENSGAHLQVFAQLEPAVTMEKVVHTLVGALKAGGVYVGNEKTEQIRFPKISSIAQVSPVFLCC
jgi:hypothetical protein